MAQNGPWVHRDRCTGNVKGQGDAHFAGSVGLLVWTCGARIAGPTMYLAASHPILRLQQLGTAFTSPSMAWGPTDICTVEMEGNETDITGHPTKVDGIRLIGNYNTTTATFTWARTWFMRSGQEGSEVKLF